MRHLSSGLLSSGLAPSWVAAVTLIAVLAATPVAAQSSKALSWQEQEHIRECGPPPAAPIVLASATPGSRTQQTTASTRTGSSGTTFFSSRTSDGSDLDLFVVNGARTGIFHETVAIKAGPSKLCTGVLVAPNAVLTAGHCVCNLGLNDANPAYPRPHVVLGGDVDVNAAVPPNDGRAWAAIDTRKTQLFDRYFCAGLARSTDYMRGRDLAVLFLDEGTEEGSINEGAWKAWRKDTGRATLVLNPPANMSETDAEQLKRVNWEERKTDDVHIATIAPPSQIVAGSVGNLLVVGFGLPESGQPVGPKRLACVPIASRICGTPQARRDFRCAAGLETVLIDRGRGRDTCGGDSGGPVFAVQRTGWTYRYTLVAITSRAVSGSDCGSSGGIYSLVTPRVVDWMRRIGVDIITYETP